jgi:hypothetical protein
LPSLIISTPLLLLPLPLPTALLLLLDDNVETSKNRISPHEMIKVPISDVGMIDDLLRRSAPPPLYPPLDVPLLVMLMPLVPPAAAACDCFRDRIIISFHFELQVFAHCTLHTAQHCTLALMKQVIL